MVTLVILGGSLYYATSWAFATALALEGGMSGAPFVFGPLGAWALASVGWVVWSLVHRWWLTAAAPVLLIVVFALLAWRYIATSGVM